MKLVCTQPNDVVVAGCSSGRYQDCPSGIREEMGKFSLKSFKGFIINIQKHVTRPTLFNAAPLGWQFHGVAGSMATMVKW